MEHIEDSRWEDIDQLTTYKNDLLQRELSKGTVDIYLRQAKRLHAYLRQNNIAGISELTKEYMIAYKKHLLSLGQKKATVNLHIVAVNSYLRYVGREDCILKTERIQKKGCLENILNREEYLLMLNYARESGHEKYYFIMKVLSFTGIRVSELAFLTVESLAEGKFTVDNKGKTREVYLPEGLAADIKDYCNANSIRSGVIFRGNRQRPISRNAVYQMLIHFADMVGIDKEKAHPHSFRHLFAVTYMKQYANLTELADILGHSSLETTRIYTATTAEERRRRLEGLNF